VYGRFDRFYIVGSIVPFIPIIVKEKVMDKNKGTEMTMKEALDYLRISRGTFLRRVKNGSIRPVNFNPALKQQHKPFYAIDDLNRIKKISPLAK
jgi:hypothetical protein